MHRPAFTRFCRSRLVFTMAFAAWAMLVAGAAVGMPTMQGSMGMPDATSMAPSATMPGDSMAMGHAAQTGQPSMPIGQGLPCCVGTACSCLASCNAVLSVPRFVLIPVHVPMRPPAFDQAAVTSMSAAPPFRPPIA
jgi:hypothetical protein